MALVDLRAASLIELRLGGKCFVRCSALIETPDEARAYYAERLAGDRVVRCRGEVDVVVRFNYEEIHLFSEEIQAGRSPDPHKLIFRQGRSGEVRLFSKARARLLDAILPTIEKPVACLRAKIRGGTLLIGPPTLEASQRLAVVVAPDSDKGVVFVRTAYPVTQTDFRRLTGERRVPWPPK